MLGEKFSTELALSFALEEELFDLAEDVQAFVRRNELWAFVNRAEIQSPEELRKAPDILDATLPSDVYVVHYVLTYWNSQDDQIYSKSSGGPEQISLQLGKSAVTKTFALRKLLDFPATFDQSQQALIDEALSPLKVLSAEPIIMQFADSEGKFYPDASEKLFDLIGGAEASGSGLVFIEAEAGRGKTILLASQAQKMRGQHLGRFPIYIPLRKLPLEAGMGWDSITQVIGIVGESAELLSRAVKFGLVTLFLDGIDEVSGRYDKDIIRNLLELMTGRLRSEQSAVVLAGRKTEARQLRHQEWTIFSIELPDLDSPALRTYVGSVVDGVVRQRSEPMEIPDEYADLVGELLADDQVKREREHIVQWIIDVLPELAQEPSLFFVQGLAAIAVGRRSGNRAPLRSPEGRLELPPVRDVCLIAALYACMRECTKVDPVAQDTYSIEGQMRVLQGLAIIASAPSLAHIPTPYELIPNAFGIDPVNAPEVNVAIVRQNAKHALLYATEAAGTYRPQFLNDWIRCSLLARIFSSDISIGKLDRAELLKIAASATRAKYTFTTLLPSMLADEPVPSEWFDALKGAVGDNIETASANQWLLRAAVGDLCLGAPVQKPLPLAEITDAEFAGFTIGEELSGSDYVLDGSFFINSAIKGACLNGVSMRGVKFINCEISTVELLDCDGPVDFDGCSLNGVAIVNTRSKFRPALSFRNCTFIGKDNIVRQSKPAYGEDQYAVVVTFENCFTEDDVGNLFDGDWLGQDSLPDGIVQKEVLSSISRGEACLARALRTFFPSHIGANGALQARKYIRLSALGRGSMPQGAPGQEELQQIFESVGFTTGGRSDHLYGPWSQVAGASAAGIALRNELVDFLLDNKNQGETVRLLIQKIESSFS